MKTISTLEPSHFPCRKKVVLCDSDPQSEELCTLLDRAGIDLLRVSSEEELRAALTASPDYLILDPDRCPIPLSPEFVGDPQMPGIVAWTQNQDPLVRERLFEYGALDFISKQEPIKETAKELQQLCETIEGNHQYHVTLVSEHPEVKERFEQLTRHRGYHLCFLDQLQEARAKWAEHDHLLPDLLVLDCTHELYLDAVLDLIHYVRIHRLSELPILVLVSEQDIYQTSKLYRAGAHDILESPCSGEKLINSITHHLDYRIGKRQLKYEQNLSSQLKAMIDSSSIVSKTDPKGIITYVNEPFCRITGYSAGELLGKPHNIIRHPDNSPLLFRQLWQTIQSKKMFHGMLMNRRKDGTPYYVDTTIAPVLDDNDEIIEYISIRYDVTPLIEKQHEIEKKRHKIQNVLDSQTSLICMVDKIKGIQQSNKRFMEFLGIESLRPEACGFQYLHELFLEIDEALHIKHGERYIWLDRLYEMKDQLVKVAMKDRHYNHHVFAIHVEKIPDSAFSEGICYLISLEDITDLNRALREAKEASEAESRFLATMSHEIRTPLNGILGFAELLGETPLTQDQRKYLEAIDYSGETLRQIINDILEVMKLERNEIEIHDEPVNIASELDAMVFPFYAQAAKKGVELLVFIDPKLPQSIMADLLKLKNIVINLLNNAIKFTPEGKKVHIRVKNLAEQEGKIKIGLSVADEGIGIREDQKERIFNPFVQADNSIAREYGGTGLGLNIVSRIISAYGGKLSLKSTFGKGSVFHTELIFHTESKRYDYECAKGTRYLYLPVQNPSKRLLLAERYLKRFECCAGTVLRCRELGQIQDDEANSILLFLDQLSLSEVSQITKQFRHARLYLVSGFQSSVPYMKLIKANVFWIHPELSWSTLCKDMGIYHILPSILPNTHTEVEFPGLRLLVAEDNEVNQFYIQELLRKLGIEFDLAIDGYEAVKKFMNGTYDLILMDINMPNLDGITATQQILRYEKEMDAVHTPIIGLSADAVAKNITSYIQKGLDGYLIKPLQKKDLIELLQERFGSAKQTVEKSAEPLNEVSQAQNSMAESISQKLELPIEIVYELFRKYISNSENLIAELEPQNDSAKLKTAIHSLKGISKNLYIEPLGSLCETFERNLPSANPSELSEELEMIKNEIHAVTSAMKGELP